mmetsp:Transcript_30876/g.72136  ORF Transcript_30876/g.72136 Transcript_30876/m.72136 type:complete len:387 (-) Transcript_30876:42-1202(-)
MGAYLSTPNTDKNPEDGEGVQVRYGVSDMQGWRMNMEDAHITKPDLVDGVSLFGIFDGHGGKEVAAFCSQHMPSVLTNELKVSSSNGHSALPKAFHKMDDMLRDERYRGELTTLSGKDKGGDGEAAAAGAGAGAGAGAKKGQDSTAASQVRQSINTSLDDVKKKGKLSQKEAMEIMVKMMALQRLEGKGGGPGAAGGEDEAVGGTAAGAAANVVVVTRKEVIVANAGDSRSIISVKGKAKELSFDHKPNNPTERARITNAGGWITDGANGHYRVNGNLNLSRSIGDLKYKIDSAITPDKQIITAEPDITRHPIGKDDEFIVVACDGVWDCMSNQEVVDFVSERLKKKQKLSDICNAIFDNCIAEDPKQSAGIGGDNMTCMIIEFKK